MRMILHQLALGLRVGLLGFCITFPRLCPTKGTNANVGFALGLGGFLEINMLVSVMRNAGAGELPRQSYAKQGLRSGGMQAVKASPFHNRLCSILISLAGRHSNSRTNKPMNRDEWASQSCLVQGTERQT